MEEKHIFVLIKFLLMQDPLLLLNPQKKKKTKVGTVFLLLFRLDRWHSEMWKNRQITVSDRT